MKNFNLLLICLILFSSLSCKKVEINNEAKLLGITLQNGIGVIDTTNRTIILKIPENVDLTSIVPHFQISQNATIYPPSEVATNFTNPVVYTITSEDKSKQFVFTVTAFHPIARFTVYDCSSWSPSQNRIPQTGATIKIYTEIENVGTAKTFDVLVSDQNAQADLYGKKGISYFISVTKDNKSNIKDGYVLDGRYDTVEEVAGSPIFANAVVGGFKFKDVNGDGRVWPDDKYNYDYIYMSTNYYQNIRQIDLYVAGSSK